MLLQRTRADSVAPVWTELVARWPTPTDLATADPDELRRVTFALGLSWRISNLQKMATVVSSEGSVVPSSQQGLLRLPGVGPYAATATRIMAFESAGLVLDSNVVRVLSRLLGLPAGPETRRQSWFIARAAPLAPVGEAREVNLAMLDFAASVCRPRQPRCHVCPLASRCLHAATEGTVRSG